MRAPALVPLILLAAVAAWPSPRACAQEDFTTAASWIWYPERPGVEGVGQTRYLRRVVRLAAPPAAAQLRVMADDGVAFTVNGKPAPAPVETGHLWLLYDLKPVLQAGENVLAFAVTNAIGAGGLLVSGLLRDADGVQQRIFSGPTFRASRQPADGWDRPGFDDAAWPAAAIVGNAVSQPWYGHPAFDLEPFLEPSDRDRYRQWREKLIALPPGLDREPAATAKLGYLRGNVALTINGAPRPALIYRGTVDPMAAHGRRQIALFRDAGVHVYCGYWQLAQCWPAPDKVDFEKLDDYVRAYLSADPHAYLMLILHLVPPEWWAKAHPDEMVRYAAGPDYNSTDECGRVERPSYASALWRNDMMALWRQCIAHLESKPWGKRVIGYQPGYGIYTEWHYFGSWTNQMPDTGPAMTAHFRAWLRQRYPAAVLDAAAVPVVEPRVAADALGLRDPATRRPVMDYYLCQQQLTADLIEGFCRAAKELTGGRVVCGAFYGYYHGVLPQTQGGHLELQRLLASPFIDYFAAPYDYTFRLMGQDARLRCLPQAFAVAGKVHMIEADTRTFLHPVEEYGRTPDAASSIAAICRELSTGLTSPTALWWCDFGADGSAGWYDDPALIGAVRSLYTLAERRLSRPRQPVAQVAVICDPPSMYLLPDAEAMRTHYELLEGLTTELYRTGTPFDSLLLAQLPQADMKRYRLLIFLDTLIVDPATRARIKEYARDHAVLWLWAPGISDGARLSPDLVQDLTGFRVALRGSGVPVAGVIAADDPLLAHLPKRTATELHVARTSPLPEALDAAQWFNPRDAATMAEQYTAFDWAVRDGALRWHFATNQGWTDIHLKAAFPDCDGLCLTVQGEDEVTGVSLRVVVKDADAAEFVAPRRKVLAAVQTFTFSFAEFTRAPWPAGSADKPRPPFTGLKLVLDGMNGAHGALLIRDLAAAWGTVAERSERAYDSPCDAHPCLVVDDPAAVVLGRDSVSGEAVLASRGSRPNRHILSTLPYVPHEVLAALMDEARVVRYVDSPDVIVRADSNLVALHTAKPGHHILHLPRTATVRDALTGEVLGRGRDVPLSLPGPSTTLLELQ